MDWSQVIIHIELVRVPVQFESTIVGQLYGHTHRNRTVLNHTAVLLDQRMYPTHRPPHTYERVKEHVTLKECIGMYFDLNH